MLNQKETLKSTVKEQTNNEVHFHQRLNNAMKTQEV